MACDAMLLLSVLRDPSQAAALPVAQWSLLVAQARQANLLGALAVALRQQSVPACARRHLAGALQLSERQHRSVRWEAHQLQQALGGLGVPVVLLKGAAYVLGAYGVGRGRLFGDIDVLVPRAALGDVESQLMLNGWVSAKTSDYDQRYYRQWMHEIPPMSHIRRGTVIDVHHTILPLTARHHPDPAQILARAKPLADLDLPNLRVPSAQDLLIHSITHLVHEGEFHNGLRDLYDIDCMLRVFAERPGFWDALQRDAVGNDLAYPVALGLQLAQRVFGSPLAPDLLPALHQASTRPPAWLLSLLTRALASMQDSDGADRQGAALARWLLYVRSHALRMPLRLVVPHLIRKAWMRWFPQKPANTAG